MLCFATAPLWAAPWSPVVSIGLLRDDNTTNAIRDQKADDAATAKISFSSLRVIDRHWQGNLGVDLTSTHWREYQGLDLTNLSVSAGLRRKFGLGPLAPRVDFSVEAGRSFARTEQRTSNFLNAEAAYSQRLNALLSWRASATLERLDARRAVFSTTAHTFKLGGNYDFTPNWRLSGHLRSRFGDLVSWCRESFPEFLGTTQWKDGIFGGDWFPYQTVSRTNSAHISLAYSLSDRSTVAISGDFSRSATRKSKHVYYNEIISLVFAHAF